MRIYNYFAALLLSVSVLASCSKGSTVDEPVKQDPVTPDNPTATLPSISFGKPGTKAMLNNDNLLYSGNKIKVYDLLSSFVGTISGWDGTSPYIEDEIEYVDGNTIWKYVSNGVYPWTATGTHKFFGYFTYDSKANLKVTDLVTPSLSGTTLTVPEITFTTATKQFDFLYSDLVERNAAEKNYNVVPLNLNHLFTALSVQVENKTDINVRLLSITFNGKEDDPIRNGIKNKNNATIAFGATSTVTLGTPEFGNVDFFPTMSQAQLLQPEESYDALTKQHSTGTTPLSKTFFMLWPQAVADISPTNLETDEDRKQLGYTHLSSDSLIVVKYEMEVEPEVWETRTTRMKIPAYSWDAGKKVSFTIQFTDKLIQLTAKVLPWDYNEYDVDYSTGALVVPNKLKFVAGTCDIDDNNKTITVLPSKTPKARFQIHAPVGGTWAVGKTEDIEYFTITPDSGTIDPDTESGWVEIIVAPNLSLERPRDMKIKLKFTVMTSGREFDANSDINIDDWTIILPQN